MNLPQRTPLYLSLTVILSYWLYNLLSVDPQRVLPPTFFEFASGASLRKLIHITIIFLLLKLEGVGWGDVGVSGKDWKRHLRSGLLYGLILFVLINVGLSSVLRGIFPRPEDPGNTVMMYFHDLDNLLAWLLLGILGGGVVEELVRIFVLTRFEKAFQKPGLYFALLCSSLVFGLGHLYQGIDGAIGTGIYGLITGLIYIRRRSALEVITIHAFSDVLGILGAYQLALHG
jgi:membrane protease YdiL (CAAX protease family)